MCWPDTSFFFLIRLDAPESRLVMSRAPLNSMSYYQRARHTGKTELQVMRTFKSLARPQNLSRWFDKHQTISHSVVEIQLSYWLDSFLLVFPSKVMLTYLKSLDIDSFTLSKVQYTV